MTDHVLSHQEFADIYSRVPRLTVEILIKGADGIYLTQRSIPPCEGQWHMPGGTVVFGESLHEAVQRIALRELGIEVKATSVVGIIEYPSHYKKSSGHETAIDHPVGVVHEVTEYIGEVNHNYEAKNASWFHVLPKNMHADQDQFLLQNDYIKN